MPISVETSARPLRVAALVDLPRTPQSGGHVKGWERLAAGAAKLPPEMLDLTVFFSGAPLTETLAPHVRLRHLPPVFSTARLSFLPYVPDHTDLAPWHPELARALAGMDAIHTTDAWFAFARTAERVSRARGIPLTTSFHTDTPAYARIFTRQTLESLFGKGRIGRFLTNDLRLPERQQAKMQARLRAHLERCSGALATRTEDKDLAASILGADRVGTLRLGVDREAFGPHRRDRAGIEALYAIPEGRFVFLFVGRVDVGKNILVLAEALERLVAEGLPLHLVVAGQGPAAAEVGRRLGTHVSLPGFVAPPELARLYASVDALALCSEVEIRSTASVEAIASACPVLAAEKSGVVDLFGRAPALWPVGSGVEAWADALRGFATDAERRAALRAGAAHYATEGIASWTQVVEEDLVALWQRVAAEFRAVKAA